MRRGGGAAQSCILRLHREIQARRALFPGQADRGLAAANKPITFPKAAVEIQVDWIPVDTVAAWLNANHGASHGPVVSADFVRQNYFITKQADGTEYAMTSMHISTKERPNWLWATFESTSSTPAGAT